MPEIIVLAEDGYQLHGVNDTGEVECLGPDTFIDTSLDGVMFTALTACPNGESPCLNGNGTQSAWITLANERNSAFVIHNGDISTLVDYLAAGPIHFFCGIN